MYVVTVEFTIKPEHVDQFGVEMVTNARASREREPGCEQFDVCRDPADPAKIFLYELYTDRAAFDAHMTEAHFKTFDKTVAPWVAAKTVNIYERLDPA